MRKLNCFVRSEGGTYVNIADGQPEKRIAHKPADGKKLMELTMPEGSLIGLLDRGGEMLIPTGQTELQSGDKIIIFGTAASMEAALAIFG